MEVPIKVQTSKNQLLNIYEEQYIMSKLGGELRVFN
jgi:hypothetical protein